VSASCAALPKTNYEIAPLHHGGIFWCTTKSNSPSNPTPISVAGSSVTMTAQRATRLLAGLAWGRRSRTPTQLHLGGQKATSAEGQQRHKLLRLLAAKSATEPMGNIVPLADDLGAKT
jgi:hypothetical protein